MITNQETENKKIWRHITSDLTYYRDSTYSKVLEVGL